MHPKHCKQLWEMRFQKILQGEKDAVTFYEAMLEKNESILDSVHLKEMLEEIKRDEQKHVRIANQLLQFVKQKTFNWEKE